MYVIFVLGCPDGHRVNVSQVVVRVTNNRWIELFLIHTSAHYECFYSGMFFDTMKASCPSLCALHPGIWIHVTSVCTSRNQCCMLQNLIEVSPKFGPPTNPHQTIDLNKYWIRWRIQCLGLCSPFFRGELCPSLHLSFPQEFWQIPHPFQGRLCNALVCGSCSPNMVQLEPGASPQRVCNSCAELRFWSFPQSRSITVPVIPSPSTIRYYNWLVVWLPFFIFPYIGNNHPNWLSYFSEGFKPPTR